MATSPPAETWFIWPIFSARVIRERSWSTRRSTSGEAPTVEGLRSAQETVAANRDATKRMRIAFIFYFFLKTRT